MTGEEKSPAEKICLDEALVVIDRRWRRAQNSHKRSLVSAGAIHFGLNIMGSRNIILIVYKFPPNSGIAGRRWAKLAKGLVSEGYIIDAIAVEPEKGNRISAWYDDINIPDLTVHFVPRKRYLKYLRPRKSTWYTRIQYQIAKLGVSIIEKGAILDSAIGWQKVMSKCLVDLIQQRQPCAICVTGGPFNIPFYVAQMRNQFPGIRFICDFRDPWLDSPFSGRSELSPARFAIELEKYQLVLGSFDYVTTPYPSEAESLKRFDDNRNDSKIVVLPHFLDPDDIVNSASERTGNDTEIRWIYGGDLHGGRTNEVAKLAGYLDKLKHDQPDLYARLSIVFYTNHQFNAQHFSDHRSVVSFSYPINKQLFEKIRDSDGCMMFSTERFKNFMTTKVIENMPYRKPYLFFGPDGEVSRFINKNRLGVGIQSYDQFLTALKPPLVFNKDFDYSEYTLAVQTQRLISLIRTDQVDTA